MFEYVPSSCAVQYYTKQTPCTSRFDAVLIALRGRLLWGRVCLLLRPPVEFVTGRTVACVGPAGATPLDGPRPTATIKQPITPGRRMNCLSVTMATRAARHANMATAHTWSNDGWPRPAAAAAAVRDWVCHRPVSLEWHRSGAGGVRGRQQRSPAAGAPWTPSPPLNARYCAPYTTERGRTLLSPAFGIGLGYLRTFHICA